MLGVDNRVEEVLQVILEHRLQPSEHKVTSRCGEHEEDAPARQEVSPRLSRSTRAPRGISGSGDDLVALGVGVSVDVQCGLWYLTAVRS